MRNVFANSQKEFTSLNQEHKALNGYAELEKMRLKESFDFTLQIEPSIDLEKTLLPPLFLQPLLENAIWHGASKAEGRGRVLVRFTLSSKTIVVEIFDNGNGFREESNKLPRESKSSLQIIHERIGLINRLYGPGHSLKILPSDLSEFKTCLRIVLPIKLLQS